MTQLIDRNPAILGGTPVFSGTRVPVRILVEHLEAGDWFDDFLKDYPTVSREQAVALLARAAAQLSDPTVIREACERREEGDKHMG